LATIFAAVPVPGVCLDASGRIGRELTVNTGSLATRAILPVECHAGVG